MLKKSFLLLLMMGMLTGCAEPTFETLGDVPHQQVAVPTLRKVVVNLPEEARQAVWSQDGEMMYLCDRYTIHLQTLNAGDLQGSIRQISGFDREKLTVVESVCGDHNRYEWVWTAPGEGTDAVFRCVLLSDGDFHYALTVSADAADAGNLTGQWNDLLGSFCLEQEIQSE